MNLSPPHDHTPPSVWSACRCCGLLQPLPKPEAGHRRVCCRCHTSFGSGVAIPHVALALAATALMLFILAQFYPLMRIEMEGLSHSARIGSSVTGLADNNLSSVAMMVLGLAIAAPLLRILVITYVLAYLHFGRNAPHLTRIFKLSERVRVWAMLDVFLLGALIALAKLHNVAEIEIGIGFWALGAVVLTLTALDTTFDRRAIWDALSPPPLLTRSPKPNTWVSCHSCELVQSVQPHHRVRHYQCRRCGDQLHHRKPKSLSRTWALVIAGFILYIPANVYPVMTVISFGRGAPSTIIGGVRELLANHDWPLAAIVFIASIVFPLLKLLGLIVLMISVHAKSRAYLKDRTRLYRVIEFVGRWSTIDVFVTGLLTALVTLGSIATVIPGNGIFAFGSVVVITMFAAETFDSRLIWDAAEAKHGG